MSVMSNNGGHQHLVQFYHDDQALIRNVSKYLGKGLAQGEALVVIATPAHRKGFIRELEQDGLDPARAVRVGRLLLCDADEMLDRFMVEGQPDAELFANSAGTLIRELRQQLTQGGVRAYGEMVDLLWKAGNSRAAHRLEQLWNKLLSENGFSLLCGYQIDIFGSEFQMGVLDDVLCAHTHVLSGSAIDDLDGAVNEAIDEVLGSRAKGVKPLIKLNFHPSWATIPQAEATILWVRNNLRDCADEILAQARRNYQAALNAQDRRAS